MHQRKRVRSLGIDIGRYKTGTYNAITDVEGVRVGHLTIIEDGAQGTARTGVTVIQPECRYLSGKILRRRGGY